MNNIKKIIIRIMLILFLLPSMSLLGMKFYRKNPEFQPQFSHRSPQPSPQPLPQPPSQPLSQSNSFERLSPPRSPQPLSPKSSSSPQLLSPKSTLAQQRRLGRVQRIAEELKNNTMETKEVLSLLDDRDIWSDLIENTIRVFDALVNFVYTNASKFASNTPFYSLLTRQNDNILLTAFCSREPLFDINSYNASGYTLLHHAATHNNLTAIHYLLRNKAECLPTKESSCYCCDCLNIFPEDLATQQDIKTRLEQAHHNQNA